MNVRRRRFGPATLFLLVALALAACSSSGTPQSEGTRVGTSPAGATSHLDPASTLSSADSVGASPQAQSKSRSPRSQADEEPEALPLDILVEPSCASVGDKVTVNVTSVPRAELTVNVFYSDHLPHDTFGRGTTDRAGRYDFTFAVPTTAPPGDAIIVVGISAETSSGWRSGSDYETLRVGVAGRCP